MTARQPEEFEPYAAVLMEIAGRIDWEQVKNYAGDRRADTWAPLLVVDSLIGGDWGTYAAEEMEKASADLDLGHGEEPTQAVFSALLAEALNIENDTLKRVELATIKKRLFPELDLTSWQIGSIIRSLGFDARKVGGMMYAFPGNREKLVEVGRGLGMDDDWFDDEDAASPLETSPE